MDPKNPLDPKLKEAYDRVMNAQFNPSQAVPSQPQTPPQPIPQNPQPMQSTVTPIGATPPPQHPDFGHIEPPHQSFQAQNQTQTPTPPTMPTNPQPAFSGFSAQNSKSGMEGTTKAKKSTSPIIIALGVVIFFALYTFIWIKIFNVSLPFMSSGTDNPLSGSNTVSAPQPAVQPTTATQPTVAPTQPSGVPAGQSNTPGIVTPPATQP